MGNMLGIEVCEEKLIARISNLLILLTYLCASAARDAMSPAANESAVNIINNLCAESVDRGANFLNVLRDVRARRTDGRLRRRPRFSIPRISMGKYASSVRAVVPHPNGRAERVVVVGRRAAVEVPKLCAQFPSEFLFLIRFLSCVVAE
jgi:hypothetical protein